MIRSTHKLKGALKGVTLIELLIAVALLALIVGPIMTSVQSMVSNNAALRDRTIAIYTAQLRMEELIDMTDAELTAEVARSDINDNYNGFSVRVTTNKTDADIASHPELTRAIVTVSSQDGVELFSMENIIFVGVPSVPVEEAP